MHILITGASGLVGSSLVTLLTQQGHTWQALRRLPGAPEPGTWDPEAGRVHFEETTPYDAVIHLAGESIATGRWTAAKRARIRDSRVRGTRCLCEALAAGGVRPEALVCASAVGFYGHRGAETLDESSPPGKGFLAAVCRDWEAAAEPARAAGLRVVHARLGVVLSSQGGALPALLTPFRFGLGGPVGSGRQFMSWAAVEDVATVLLYLCQARDLSGPVNVVAPAPVTNRQFARTLGRILHRPALLPLPGPVARLILGRMAQDLLLASARVLPRKLAEVGFEFQYPDLEPTLRGLLGRVY